MARVFRLFLTRELTHQQIADELGLARRTVSHYIKLRQAAHRLSQSRKAITNRRALNQYFRLPRRVAPTSIRRSNPGLYTSVMIQLTARQRQTFQLYFEEGLKAPEIAQQLGVGRSAITRQITRIRKAFRRVGLPDPKHAAEGRKRTRLRSLSSWSSDSY